MQPIFYFGRTPFFTQVFFCFFKKFFFVGEMPMKPMPIRFTAEQDARLSALAASGDFTKQELVRLAVKKLFERLDAGEEVVVQKVLRAAGAGAGARSGARVAEADRDGKLGTG
jgi:hypothetical protein